MSEILIIFPSSAIDYRNWCAFPMLNEWEPAMPKQRGKQSVPRHIGPEWFGKGDAARLASPTRGKVAWHALWCMAGVQEGYM